MFDLFSIRNEENFFELYMKEILKSTSSNIEEAIVNTQALVKSIIPTISFSSDSLNDISVRLDTRDLKKNRKEILDLPEKIARKKHIQILICIDEFQNIQHWEDSSGLQKELRTAWQHHDHVSYCIYGSKRHMMRDIFHKTSNPFYRFGTTLFLEKIEKKHWLRFIENAFSETGKTISNAQCERIADTMKNHPYYVQQLSHILWSMTKRRVMEKAVDEAIDEIINTNTPFFIREFESFSKGQIHLLQAICSGETRLNSSGVLQKYRLGTSGNASKNKKYLEEQDIIDIGASSIEFIDPVFELWFRSRIRLN